MSLVLLTPYHVLRLPSNPLAGQPRGLFVGLKDALPGGDV